MSFQSAFDSRRVTFTQGPTETAQEFYDRQMATIKTWQDEATTIANDCDGCGAAKASVYHAALHRLHACLDCKAPMKTFVSANPLAWPTPPEE